MRQFRLDDKVVYTGEKLRSDLAGKMGVVLAPISGNEDGFVVDFGSDVYVMSAKVMAPFQGNIRTPENRQAEKKEKKDLLVEKRRGNKRTNQDDE